MGSTIDRIKQGVLYDFPGGIHPPGQKQLSNQTSIETIPLPSVLHVHTKQHIGVEGQICVEEGQKVLKGQALTKSMNPFAVPVHAPTSGTVISIKPHVSAHPSALPENCIHIQPDGEEQWCELTPVADYLALPKAQLVEVICQAGISGMGGAGFPTHIKVSPKKDVEFLIINGVECEPYITSDDRLMREHAWQIRQGIEVLAHLLQPQHIIVAIEDNKPEAIEAMKVACQDNEQYSVSAIPTKYPAGGEKQLIQVLTNREVPKQGLPVDVGVIMQNVGTCFAIADAIFNGKPLVQRVTTLTGQACAHPKNVWALLGTPVEHLMQQAGYQVQKYPRLVMGGPMMGFSLASEQVPVIKSTNCILAPTEQEMPLSENERACIRCGACADACPMGLLPQQLFWHSKAKELDKAQDLNLFDCIECGACAYVCPSEIPLVHYYRTAKADIRIQEAEAQKAEHAKRRFEARNDRLEREKQEREEKHKQAAAARKQAMQADGGEAKSKIAAAMARVKAKQQAATEQAPASENNQDKVAAAIARAKAKKAQQADENQSTNTDAGDGKKVQVAAAIARAKAKKAQQQAEATQSSEAATPAEDDKKARVAAAIARAKAKKQAQQQTQAEENTATESPSEENSEPAAQTEAATETNAADDKKARIAAAVAKAKAKKQAQQQTQAEENTATESPSEENSEPTAQTEATETSAADDKKARIAAAVAKAKAKKQAQQQTQTEETTPVEKPTEQSAEPIAQSETAAETNAEDDRKARIAAAVAKAKAKKLAAQKDKS